MSYIHTINDRLRVREEHVCGFNGFYVLEKKKRFLFTFRWVKVATEYANLFKNAKEAADFMISYSKNKLVGYGIYKSYIL